MKISAFHSLAFVLLICGVLVGGCGDADVDVEMDDRNPPDTVYVNVPDDDDDDSPGSSGSNDRPGDNDDNDDDDGDTTDDDPDDDPEPGDNTPDTFAGTVGTTRRESTRGPEAGAAILTDVRIGRHKNYDRVVFEFEGRGLPAYKLEYVDKPIYHCGSGDVVPVAGDAWLDVHFNVTHAHTEEGKPTVGFRERRLSLPVLKEIESTCDFEAEVSWVLGVGSPNKYRAVELTNPSRLVVDIKH